MGEVDPSEDLQKIKWRIFRCGQNHRYEEKSGIARLADKQELSFILLSVPEAVRTD